MPTPAEKLVTIRDQILDRLLEITLNPKPNYSIEGQSVSHVDLFKALSAELKEVQDLMTVLDPYYLLSVQP